MPEDGGNFLYMVLSFINVINRNVGGGGNSSCSKICVPNEKTNAKVASSERLRFTVQYEKESVYQERENIKTVINPVLVSLQAYSD